MISSWVWNLLNLYLLMSLCAILFDLQIILSAGARQRLQQRRTRRLQDLLEQQLALVRQGQPPADALQRRLFRRLRHIGQALVFSALADAYTSRGDREFAQYLSQSTPLVAGLCRVYQRRQPMHRATFAWLLACCRQNLQSAVPFLLSCITQSDSIYCRENALTALYRAGNSDTVVHAMKQMSQRDIHHNQKLMVDGLLSFQGDRTALCAMLWESFPTLSPGLRLTVVDFIRLLGADYRQALLPLLDDPNTDDELCFSILRYYGRYHYPAACVQMLAFLTTPRNGLWEYAAVSASVLRSYPSQQVVRGLTAALSSANWYVRYNAAESLVAMDLPQQVYAIPLNGPDAYARDILRYMLDRKERTAATRAPLPQGGKSLART